MGPFDFLVNGAQGVTAPTTLGLAGSTMQLGQLANQVQSGNINLAIQRAGLAAMQDPQYGAAMSQLFGQATGEPASGDSSALQQWVARNPIGAMGVMGQRAQLLTSLSQVGKNNADAQEAVQSARNAVYQQFTNLASAYGNGTGALSDSQKRMVWSLTQRAAQTGAIPFGFVPEIATHLQSDPDGGRAFLRSIGVGGVNFGEQASGGLASAKTPGTPGLIAAQTGEATANAGAIPVKAGAAALTANTNAAKTVAGDYWADPVSGQLYRRQLVTSIPGYPTPTTGAAPASAAPPNAPVPATPSAPASFAPANPQEAAALAAVRARNAQGQPGTFEATANGPVDLTPAPTAPPAAASPPGMTPVPGVQGALTPGQEGQKSSLADQLKSVGQSTQLAQRIEQILPGLRALVTSGYNGTLAGSEAGRDLLNFATSVGALSQDQATKVGNMRASDALVTELLGPLARSMSSRGSNAAIRLAQLAKPGSENSAQLRLQMINALHTDAINQINYGRALNGYVSANPSDIGLSGFKAPAPLIPPTTNLNYVNSLPDPKTSVGTVAVGDDGTRYQSNGQAWVRLH